MRVIEPPGPEMLSETPEQFIERLEEPVVIVVPGADRRRCRLVVTLLHGDEPSGVTAIRSWLLDGPEPQTDIALAIANVEAARAQPPFSRRFLAGRADLNRCFWPIPDSADGAIARSLLEVIERLEPESIVDLHNTSGDNPPYAISTRLDDDRRRLAGLFADMMVHTDLVLGTMLDATAAIPGVSIECGQSRTPRADAIALRGIRALADNAELPDTEVTVYEHPVRVTLVHDRVDIRPDLDRLNFRRLRTGERILRVRAEAAWPVRAAGADGRDVSHELFALDGDQLVVTRTVIPSMITTRVDKAVEDCLCYVLSES